MSQTFEFLVRHGAAVVFFAVLAEQLGVPLPAAPVLLAAGALVATGQMHLLLVLVAALKKADLKTQLAETNTGDIGLIHNLGMALFHDYVVPFEISSVLFLSAMVGVVVIGKSDEKAVGSQRYGG